MPISGTYRLKYYKQFKDERGKNVRLEIHCRNYAGAALQIGRLQGLSLQIQGNEDVDAPIVKTSLQFGLLDDPFVPGLTTSGVKIESTGPVRYANWTEFYTPDSTLYFVKLWYDNLSSSSYIWAGYITPDSYSESLDSFGSVIITARDNLGHLQDFDFDMTPNTDGLIKVRSIIDNAIAKINFPMTLLTRGFSIDNDDYYLETEDGERSIGDLYVNAAAFEDMNWYNALEETLNSIGFCMRFVGYHAFLCAPYRLMPKYGYDLDSEVPQCDVEFYGRHTGTRTFEPAYREIVEKIEFNQQDDRVFDPLWAKAGTKQYKNELAISFFDQDVVDPFGQVSHHKAANSYYERVANSHTGNKKDGWTDFPVIGILDDENFPLQDYTEETEGAGMHNYLFIGANQGSISYGSRDYTINWNEISAVFSRKVRSTQMKVLFEFAPHPAGFDENGKLGVYGGYNLHHIKYQVYYSKGGQTRYWNGNYWQEAYKNLQKDYTPLSNAADSLEIELLDCDELGANGRLTIILTQIVYQSVGYWFAVVGGQLALYWVASRGVYARLKSVTFTSAMTKKAKSDTVKTIVNSAYNVRCERKPLFGCLPTSVNFIDPGNYMNAFFIYDDDGNVQAAPYKWRWNTDSVAVPFPVKIHQQLLMFHYATEQLLEGDCGVNHVNTGLPHVVIDAVYWYKQKFYHMKSCTFDLIKGRLTSVQLRSYKNYDDLWNGNETYNGNSSGSVSSTGGVSLRSEVSHSEDEMVVDD